MLADEKEGLTPQELGGLARKEALGAEERSEISRKAAVSRWTAPRATHEGLLRIGKFEIPCAVLADNTRVLSRIGFLRAIGRTGKAKGGRRYDEEFQLPVFLTAENLKQFIGNDLIENSKSIPYRPLAGGSLVIGYRWELLPSVCHVFMDAKEAGVLRANQLHIAETCKILSRGFSLVGLTALIDEATGFQEVRDRHALEAILDQFLRAEHAKWAKRFPEEFYREIFRLNKWTWRGMRVNRPQVVAHYTKDVVYSRITPDLLDKLESLNPKDETGRRPVKHFQWLTDEIGIPALTQHIHAATALMRASDTWKEFKVLLDRALPRKTKLSDLPLFSQPVEPIEPPLPASRSRGALSLLEP